MEAGLSGDVTVLHIFVTNSKRRSSMLELFTIAFLLVICFLTTILGTYIVRISSILHWNLRHVFLIALMIWTELATSRALVLVFQTFLFVDGSAEDLTMNPVLICAAFFRYHYLFHVSQMPLIVILERGFATLLIKDYERKKRPWIFWSLALSSCTFALGLAVGVLTGTMHLRATLIICAVPNVCAVLLYGVLERFNRRRLKAFDKFRVHKRYSLSVRFQLQENFKIFLALKWLFFIGTSYIVLNVLLKTLPMVFEFSELLTTICNNTFDVLVQMSPLFDVPLAVGTVEEYRKTFLREFRRHTQSWRARPNDATSDDVFAVVTNSQAADIYFEMFNKDCKNIRVK